MEEAAEEQITALRVIVDVALPAVVAAAIAWLTARQRFQSEMKKLELGAQQKVLDHLIAARLEMYPDFYELVSNLVKLIEGQVVTAGYVNELKQRVDRWDSRNAILLSEFTTQECYEFRYALDDLEATVSAAENLDSAEAGRKVEALKQRAWDLELGLKRDLGVFGVELEQPKAKEVSNLGTRKGDYLWEA